jgi:hypothetical protein
MTTKDEILADCNKYGGRDVTFDQLKQAFNNVTLDDNELLNFLLKNNLEFKIPNFRFKKT